MRVSSSQIFDLGTLAMQNNQAQLLNTQTHIASGRRILTPEDDPVAAAQALVVAQSKGVTENYIENQGKAGDQLKFEESQLSAVTDTIQSALERTIQAGNGALSDADRKSIAGDLRQKLASLISTANSQDGTGRFIFAGFRTNVQPFVSINDPTDASIPASALPHGFGNPYVNYQGDQGPRALQVNASRVMPVADNGSDVFMRITDQSGNVTGRSVFDSMKNLIDTLEKPIAANPTFQADYAQELGDLHAVLDNTLRVRASVGSRVSELDALSAGAADVKLQYQQTLSNLQDLDYTQAITTLQRQQVQLQAAQQSFAKIGGLSLFNVL